MTIKIGIEWLEGNDDIKSLARATSNSAGFDLPAAIKKSVQILPSSFKLIPLGFKLAIPHGFEGQVRPRSGLAINFGISVLNSPGTIDSDYRGELKAILINLGNNMVTIKRGDRIAQLIIAQLPDINFVEKKILSDTPRSSGGFGSTGI
ncbi:MAG: Deoxyuridine 5'-triphosphate nucleotidohydrolase [Alphaproteobacteria bacterium MarineAlpha2_Bin1]|nr:MAG: Deoxyuridine 5'-triphosphate nucleotidohydrolase [Alphaproteobacteria bacterium MarineAlpha2_Bin1]